MRKMMCCLAIVGLLAGCENPGDSYSIQFQPLVNGSAFDCASEVTGLGTTDASSWITGALIPMDGGNLAMNAGGTPGWTTSVNPSD